MIRTYKILSLLLAYPSEELQEFLPEAVKELTDEGVLGQEPVKGVHEFAEHYMGHDLIDWQADYVQLFDATRSASLYLFEHLKGDSKDRGQAMVDLIEQYSSMGMQLSSSELPDYLPVFLEFLSSLSPEEAAHTLSEAVNVISLIHRRLEDKKNIYRHLLSAVVSLSASAPDTLTDVSLTEDIEREDPDAGYDQPVRLGNESPCFKCK